MGGRSPAVVIPKGPVFGNQAHPEITLEKRMVKQKLYTVYVFVCEGYRCPCVKMTSRGSMTTTLAKQAMLLTAHGFPYS